MTDFNSKKADALLYMSVGALVREDLDFWNSLDGSNSVFDKKFNKRIKKLFLREAKHYADTAPIRSLKRALVTCLIILSAAFLLSMSIAAVRNEFLGTISKWFDEYVVINFIADDTAAESIIKKEPAYIPDGYEKIVGIDTPFMCTADYYFNKDLMFSYSQQPISSGSAFDNENCEISELKINGFDAILFKGSDYNTLYYHDDISSYTITGCISSDELIKIANSIQ